MRDLRRSARRETLRDEAVAGLVVGVESVPDGLANGLLAGINPVSGVYAYLFGMAGGALLSSTALMSVQGTGAMATIVADVDLASRDDPSRALFTLTLLTGVVMLAAGLLGLGRLLRFISTAVITGFVTAVGLSIVLGQLDALTGYDRAPAGGSRTRRSRRACPAPTARSVIAPRTSSGRARATSRPASSTACPRAARCRPRRWR